MSLTSRGLLTKIYQSNSKPSHRKIKQKSTLSLNSFKNNKKIKPKSIISSAIKENENEEDNKKIINKEHLKNILKENNTNDNNINSNKFPIIPRINITNIKIINDPKSKKTINETKNSEILEKNTKLNYKLIESSSEDDQHPLRELKKGLSGQGWQSSRFGQYPQFIYIQFYQPVFIKKIELVFHETNIPSMVKFYSYIPKHKDEFISNYKSVNYDYIGFIKSDNNERHNFEFRESRKIYLNSKSLFLKLELEKNHFNKFNLFNQIGIIKLEFFGDYLPFIGGNNNNNKLVLKHAIKKNYQNDFDLEKICGQKLTELKKQMNYNIEIENYMECKEIKNKIEKLRLYGKRIFDLESEKNIAINNEDFSKAIEIKNLVDKLKINLQNIDTTPSSPRFNDTYLLLNDFDNQTIKTKKFSNIQIDLNNMPVSNSYENSLINESIYSTINDNNNINHNNISIKNNNISILNNSISPSNNNAVISEDIFGSYDETILPTVLKRLNHEETKQENEIGEAEKGTLEPISKKLLEEFNLIANVLGEENMQKIFSKQILWREEGLILFIEKINDILQKNNNSNEIISMILKLSMILLEEKHPSGVIKTLEIIKQLFEYIKKHDVKLNIEPKVTDGVLIKIKEKLGDINPKVRAKSVSLYCYMLSLNFCDYNNLISELIEEDIKNNNKYIPKSSNLILGKLDIFINIFNNFDDAIKMKRTNKEEFPSFLLMEYLIYNISHNKPEVRKKTRNAINLLLKNFGIQKFKKKLEKIDERELIKLIREIPDLQHYFPDIELKQKNDTVDTSKSKIKGNSLNTNISNIQKKKVSKVFFKKNKRLSKKIILKTKIESLKIISNSNEEKQDNKNNDKSNDKIKIKIIKEAKKCKYCRNNIKEGEIMINHWASNCPMFTKCEKCNMNLEVKNLNYHKGNECKFKNEYKLCNNCNEYILVNEYDSHQKNNCSVNTGFVKCPLCHQSIKNSDEDFYQHLIIKSCPSQKRNI